MLAAKVCLLFTLVFPVSLVPKSQALARSCVFIIRTILPTQCLVVHLFLCSLSHLFLLGIEVFFWFSVFNIKDSLCGVRPKLFFSKSNVFFSPHKHIIGDALFSSSLSKSRSPSRRIFDSKFVALLPPKNLYLCRGFKAPQGLF